MLENGVMEEFYLAMSNLQANVANGKASSGFKYLGPGTGTYPAADQPRLVQRIARFRCDESVEVHRARTGPAAPISATSTRSIPIRAVVRERFCTTMPPRGQRRDGRHAGQFLHDQSQPARRRHLQGNGGYSRYDSMVDRIAAADVEGTAGSGQLRLGQSLRHVAVLVPPGPGQRSGHRHPAAHLQAQLGVGTAVRQRAQCSAAAGTGSIASSAAGNSTASSASRAATCRISATSGWSA